MSDNSVIILPHQKSFLDATEAFPALFGGVGNGKTTAGCWAAIEHCAMNKENLFLVGRLTYPELNDSTKEVFLNELSKFYAPHHYKHDKSKNSIELLHNKSKIIFRHLDNAASILSMNLGGFYIDQAEEIEEDVFNTLMTRLRRKNIKHRQGYITGNPEFGSWVYYKYGLDKIEPTAEFNYSCDNKYYRMINVATRANRDNLPSDYEEQIASGVSAEYFDRFVGANWWVADTCVFNVSKVNGILNLPSIEMVFISLDPAISKEKEACDTGISVLGVGSDGHFYDLEHIGEQLSFFETLERITGLLKKYTNCKYITVENNGYQDALREACQRYYKDVYVLSVRANKDKSIRAKAVSHIIEAGLFHTNDKALISEMGAYKPNSRSRKKRDRVDALVHNLKAIQQYAPTVFNKAVVNPVDALNGVSQNDFEKFRRKVLHQEYHRTSESGVDNYDALEAGLYDNDTY